MKKYRLKIFRKMQSKTGGAICSVAVLITLGACGQPAAEQNDSQQQGGQGAYPEASHPSVSPLDPCSLLNPKQLETATGYAFDDGEKRGPQCYFSTTNYASTASVSTGLKTVADHLDKGKIEISGLHAVQGESPEGDQCLVDVTLEPDAPVDTLSTSISGADPTGDPCRIAVSVARQAIPQVKD